MEELQRPLPPRSLMERLRAWIEWFGYARIVGSAFAVVIVCAGAYWLVRVPPPPTEASLPIATTSIAAPTPDESITDAVSGSTELTEADQVTATAAPVVVHVAGAVATAGVYELPGGSRVEGAIAAAGGVGPDADPNALNLAAPLVDGSRVYVPRVGEEVPVPLVVPVATPTATGAAAPVVVDVNSATVAELESLPGVGPATALAIVSERDGNGPFVDVADLDRVPGIGPAKIEALRDLVTT